MIIDGHMHCPDGGDVKAQLETYDKVFFGTDVPVADIPWIVRSFLDMMAALGLDDATRRKLLSDNARAFYRI